MSKKNLPNIPIYIGDWERDCNILTLESEMAWMKIIFKMHLSGKQSIYKISTKSLQILWKSSTEKVFEILEELNFNEICEIKEVQGGYEFTCRRIKKENEISEIRSDAVNTRYKDFEKGKKTPATKPLQTNYKKSTKHVQITDYDNDNESDYENEVKSKDDIVINTKIDFQKIVEVFNSVCVEIPKVEKITKPREAAIAARVKEYGFEKIGDVFRLASESDFLNGRKKDWKASFDWIMNPTNFQKILEGNYKNLLNGKSNHNASKSDTEHKQSAVAGVNALFGIK
jgi:hypothetical protein